MNEHLTLAPPPYRAAPDTWVIPELFDGPPGAYVPVNSVVITGAEPVIVDTGTALNRDRWLEAVWSLVDPADVRWIFLSHDDHDHVGNLGEVLAASPQATLVTTWFMLERLAGDLRVPLERCRWVNDGESFDAGDRTFHLARPPIFDSPTTRGLFDSRTGFYWAADSFASLVDRPVTDVGDLDPGFWRESFLQLNRLVSPWHTLVDPARFDRHVEKVEALPITAMAGAHGTVMNGSAVDEAFGLVREAIRMEAAPVPGQADLEAMIAAVAA
jgi:flavorubredoxin